MGWTNSTKFAVEGKQVELFPSAGANRPIIYLNSFSPEYRALLRELDKLGCPDFSLAVISNLEWDHDMAPWDIPPISREDTPCTGGADEYLGVLVDEIIPKVEGQVGKAPFRGIAGYSLAGLFAIYALYHTDAFSCVASISGSFWFPDFKGYAMSHELKGRPEHLYFSLGDKECKTGNATLQPVQENTEALVDYYRGLQIDTEYRLNTGNHFVEAFYRTAMGIEWLLSRAGGQ